MREIKFRLRDRHNKIVGYEKWYVGDWKADEGENFASTSGYYVAQPCWLYSSDNKHWTPTYIPHRYKDQYTGLKDKNGVEIYDGDIVTLLDLEHGEELLTISVKWSEQGLNFNVYPSHDPKKDWVVIGNIYENPEFLEEKKP